MTDPFYVCTLFEGDYDLGVAALLNSLQRSGFDGTVLAFHRGPRPAWSGQVGRLAFEVRWLPAPWEGHLTLRKPDALAACFAAGARLAAYVDPDVVVELPQAFLRSWLEDAVALCLDVNWNMPPGHPMRRAWQRRFPEVPLRPRSTYVNAGFVGLDRDHRALLREWALLNDVVRESAATLKVGGPFELFHSSDQDALNIALARGDWPVSELGPDAMGFVPGAAALPHAVGVHKPWRGGAARRALGGHAPGPARRAWLDAVTSGPLEPLDGRVARRLRRDLRLAALIARFYSR